MNSIPSAQRLLVAAAALVLAWAPAATLAAPRLQASAAPGAKPHEVAADPCLSAPVEVHASL